MCTKRSIICITFFSLLAFLSCNNQFDKDKFLEDCKFSIEDNILSDSDEYEAIYQEHGRMPDKDSLYRLFHQTQDHSINLQICRIFGQGTFLRFLGRGSDSLLVDNFFARAIKSSSKKDEIVELVLLYGFDKPYPYQKLISEVCLRPEYYVNDSLKYIALNYAIHSNYNQDDCDMGLVRYYCRERMPIAAAVFGDNSEEAYRALFECAQLTQFHNGKERDIADSLFRYHKNHEVNYRDGRIVDLYSDPLYIRYISCLEEGEIKHATDILMFLTKSVALEEDPELAFPFSESKVMLLYENARLRYLLGMDESEYKGWLDAAIEKSISYLSPTGGYSDLNDFIKPDHMFYSPVVDWMDVAYNTPSSEEAYDIALFLKGTSALITPDLIRFIKRQGNTELIAYVDSTRQYYRGNPFAHMNLKEYMKSPEAKAWSKRESYIKNELEACLSLSAEEDVWKSCYVKTKDIYDALMPDESAVEIIRMDPFSGDDYIYEALVLNFGQPIPTRIKVCDKKTLVELIRRGHLYDNTSRAFFDTIIKPMMSCVTGKNVYLAPDGLFSLINFSSISDGNGGRISDNWNIIQCISTKTICESERDKELTLPSIVLFGGMEYEPGSYDQRSYQDSTLTRDVERNGFGYLPGTLEEVNKIYNISSSFNVNSLLFTGLNGTERAFRSLSGKDISIIHIATHGYYYNTEDLSTKSYYQLSGKKEEALNRCGLLFTNSQNAWLNGIDVYDTANGILLGSEIANLDLLNTDLVVLSACNTGLGDITSEGVTGLQMAFKRAGVKTLLMTLGKVDDEATAFFMTTFYENLFSGKDKHLAFKEAINTMRSSERFSDPKYWSPFIMID